MRFSTILPVAFCLAASTLANPMALPKHKVADVNVPQASENGKGNESGQGNASGQGNESSQSSQGSASAQANVTGTVNVSAQTQSNVSSQINKWLGDIATVNNFVDTVGNVTDQKQISSMAATAFTAAQDEGTSNTVLSQAVQLGAAGQSASQALVGQFNIIGPAINDTIANPQNLQKNLAAINGARCPPPQGNGAISQEGEVQAAAASAAGVNNISPPQTPTACISLAQATN